MNEKTCESNFRMHPTKKSKILTIGVKSQLVKEKSFKQTPADRNIAILRYLRKWDGDWKNKNEIGIHHGITINPGRLALVLDELYERGLIDRRESQNPQAKPYEYKIMDLGKEKLKIFDVVNADPTLKFIFGITREHKDD